MSRRVAYFTVLYVTALYACLLLAAVGGAMARYAPAHSPWSKLGWSMLGLGAVWTVLAVIAVACDRRLVDSEPQDPTLAGEDDLHRHDG